MFNIKSAGDFYAVLVEDFDDFVAEPHSARRALHCAITAFHLYEWVWGDWLSKDKVARDAMGIASRDRDAFLQWIDRYCVLRPALLATEPVLTYLYMQMVASGAGVNTLVSEFEAFMRSLDPADKPSAFGHGGEEQFDMLLEPIMTFARCFNVVIARETRDLRGIGEHAKWVPELSISALASLFAIGARSSPCWR